MSSQDLAQCSHVITGSFDHLLRVWRVCNAERIIPKAISASVCAPSFCDLLYPSELQADGTVLLLAMEPRCSLLVGDAIIVYLAGFGIIDAEAGSKGCTSSANRCVFDSSLEEIKRETGRQGEGGDGIFCSRLACLEVM
jgi:hypothetical protein